MEKPYLNLHFKSHDFFPWNNEDMKILSFEFFFFPNLNQFSLVKFLFEVWCILKKLIIIIDVMIFNVSAE